MTAPAVTSTGQWIGGCWPNADAWRDEWVSAWAGVGWLASTDLLQEAMAISTVDVRTKVVMSEHAIEIMRRRLSELLTQVNNLDVDLARLSRKVRLKVET